MRAFFDSFPMIDFPSWVYDSLWGNTIIQYVLALAIFGIAVISLYIFKTVIIHRLKALSERTPVSFDNALVRMIEGYGWPLYVFLSLYITLQFLEVSGAILSLMDDLTIIIGVYYAVKSIQSLIQYGFYGVVQRRLVSDKNFDPAILELFEKVIDILLWVGGVLVIFQNFGFNVSTLLGGLGIGGIAIAFALQNVLADLFASIAIFFDKPFKSGDFIIVGTDMGVVKKIGVKSTRIESLDGQELIVSNKELTEVRVNNFKQMSKRRVVFRIGVAYQTTSEQLHQVKELISRVIDETETASLDRVHFYIFGESSLTFEAVFYVLSGDFNTYMDTQETINFGVKEGIEALGVEIAYPTQTVYIKHDNEAGVSP